MNTCEICKRDGDDPLTVCGVCYDRQERLKLNAEDDAAQARRDLRDSYHSVCRRCGTARGLNANGYCSRDCELGYPVGTGMPELV